MQRFTGATSEPTPTAEHFDFVFFVALRNRRQTEHLPRPQFQNVAGEVVFVKRCEIIAMRLSCLLLSRLKAVLSNQSFTLFLCASEIASSGFAASSNDH
jgi:hypothetical protein